MRGKSILNKMLQGEMAIGIIRRQYGFSGGKYNPSHRMLCIRRIPTDSWKLSHGEKQP
jgi:hypothetical protein